MSFRTVVLTMVLSVVCVTGASAVVPNYINFQGSLTDSAGTPVTDTHSMQFSLYADSSGGSPLWSETHTSVDVTDGLFRVFLGSINPFPDSAFFGHDLWLETTIESEILTPRTAMGSTPFGFHAVFADSAAYALSSPATNAWMLSGNSSTTPGTDFIGTTDNQELQIKVNNSKVMTFYPNTTSPNIIAGCSQNLVGNDVLGATISGGGDPSLAANYVSDRYGTVGGGRANRAGDGYGTVWDGAYATVCGGNGNIAGGQGSVICGGENNEAQGDYSVISGGQWTDAVGNFSVIGGGYACYNSGNYGTVAGGQSCRAEADQAAVCGGGYNWSTSSGAFIGGGNSNRATDTYSAITGGRGNYANGWCSITAGGEYNTTDTSWTTIGGGRNNTVSAECGTIAGGCFIVVDGSYGAIGGGSNNIASGIASAIPGGMDNLAEGDYTVAMGRQAQAVHDGSFVWADGSGSDYTTTSDNQFLIRAQGGVGIGTNNPQHQLDVAGGMGCMSLHEASDVRLKSNITTISDALDKVSQIRGVEFEWNQNAETLGAAIGQEQLGVVAQEVESILPQLVTTSNDGYKSVDYTKLIAVLVEAVKELQAENKALREELTGRIEKIETVIQR
jgi:hypothetical protein